MRGKPSPSHSDTSCARITPACAGKTLDSALMIKPKEDHPRVCGENTAPAYAAPSVLGSPPRVRGKHTWSIISTPIRRITPACAGKTSCDSLPSAGKKDHPRVCGENGMCINPSSSCIGSPPRVRGKRACCDVALAVFRITPACAGKTYKTPLRGDVV